MSECDAKYFEALDDQLQELNYQFKLIIELIRNYDKDSCKYWNNNKQMNDLYIDTANALRTSSVRLIEHIQSANKKNDMIVNAVKVNVPEQGQSTIYRVIKKEAVALHFLIEEFVSKSAPFLQSNGTSSLLSELESIFANGMKHFTFVQGGANCLQKELDKNGISYNLKNEHV